MHDDFDGGPAHLVEFALSSLIAPALLLDGGALVEKASPAALSDLGISPDLLIGRSVERAIGVSVEELRRAAADGSARLAAVEGTSIRWRATSLDGLRPDGGWLVDFILEDMTEGEASLVARSARLEEVLDDLTDRFEAVNRYVGLISHDLQAPTRRLLSLVELLRNDIATDAPTDERIDAIERGARHLLKLTSELLVYSRLGNRPMILEPVDAQGVLDEVLEQLQLKLQETAAHVSVPQPLPSVTANATFLGVVFQNLLENAVKYARPDVEPRVEITWSAAGDDVRIDVRDNGIGIASEQWHSIFEPFRRLHSGDGSHSGLGLATVRDLVRRFGGTILVSRSEEHVGTTFTIVLPGPSLTDRPAVRERTQTT